MTKEETKKGSSLLEEWLDENIETEEEPKEIKARLLKSVSDDKLDELQTLQVEVKINRDTHDGKSVQAAIDFMKARPDNAPPFAVFLPLSFPHPPYSAPHPYAEMYNESTVGTIKSRDLPGKPEFHQLIQHYHEFDQLETEKMQIFIDNNRVADVPAAAAVNQASIEDV